MDYGSLGTDFSFFVFFSLVPDYKEQRLNGKNVKNKEKN